MLHFSEIGQNVNIKHDKISTGQQPQTRSGTLLSIDEYRQLTTNQSYLQDAV